MFEKVEKKYDLIFANLLFIADNITLELYDIYNFNIYLYQLYYAILRLNINGSIVFPVLQIRNKKTADLDEGVMETYRKDALRSKFDVKTDMGRMLQSTNYAKLVQFRRNAIPKPDITLMEVRAEGQVV
jgi:hypothetical protein